MTFFRFGIWGLGISKKENVFFILLPIKIRLAFI